MTKLLVCLSLGLSISSAMASFHGGEGIGNGKANRGCEIVGGYCLCGGDGSSGGKTSAGEGSGGRSLAGGDMDGGKIKYKVCIK